MKPLWDYHTHCGLNHHAIGTSEEYIQSAIKKGLCEIGLADHFPMHLLPESADVWKFSMTMAEFDKYIRENKELQQKYKDKITIKIASEVDYHEGSFSEYQKALSPYYKQLDYIIGSIHVVEWPSVPAWGVDDINFLEKFDEFGTDKVYIEYYNLVQKMAKTGYYQIVGHLDLPKKHARYPSSPEKVWDVILNTLDTIAANNMAMEINTSGFLKPAKEQYPAMNIVQAAIERKIPITLGSDSHDPINIGSFFPEVVNAAKKIGLTHLCQFTQKEKTLIPID